MSSIEAQVRAQYFAELEEADDVSTGLLAALREAISADKLPSAESVAELVAKHSGGQLA